MFNMIGRKKVYDGLDIDGIIILPDSTLGICHVFNLTDNCWCPRDTWCCEDMNLKCLMDYRTKKLEITYCEVC